MRQGDIYYQAMLARDPRFDGKFFVGVKTTGVYCRPICPARPKRQNIEFFANALAAERAGYRPCLRCRPESAPLSPAWIGKSAVVQRAVKSLHSQEALKWDEDRFAERFGVTPRHLRRLFVEELGKTPRQLAAEIRLNLARKLVVETQLSIADAAYAAGFKSLRRFNDAFKKRFRKCPSEIRRVPLATESAIIVSLPYRPPLGFLGLCRHYQAHRVGELEWFTPGKMHRVAEINGHVGTITISDDPERSRLLVNIEFKEPTVIYQIISRVRAMFDLDSDPVAVANALECDNGIKKLLRKYSGVRLPSGWDPFEVAVATILGQFVSVARGTTLVADLVKALGADSGVDRDGYRIQLFPSPQKLATADLTFLKTTSARKQTLKAFAQAVAEQQISLEPTQYVEDFKRQILGIPGIGPWTAEYMALKVLRHADAFPETDLILKRALELHSKDSLARMSPWRGYAAILFWNEYADQLKKRRGK